MSASGVPEAAWRSAPCASSSWRRRWLGGQASELVGECLAVEHLVALAVAGRDTSLLAEVTQQVALLIGERAGTRARHDHAVRIAGARSAIGHASAQTPSTIAVVAESEGHRRVLGGAQRRLSISRSSCTVARRTSFRPLPLVGRATAAIGIEGLDGGAGGDRKEGVEVELGGEGIADG